MSIAAISGAAMGAPRVRASVAASPSGNCNENAPASCLATSTAAVVVVTGGAGGYTYLWEKVSGDAITITSSTGSSTTFSATTATPDTLNAIFKCTVTDSLGRVGVSNNVAVELTFTDIT